MPRLSDSKISALGLLEGGKLFRAKSGKTYGRRGVLPVSAVVIDGLAKDGLVTVFDMGRAPVRRGRVLPPAGVDRRDRRRGHQDVRAPVTPYRGAHTAF